MIQTAQFVEPELNARIKRLRDMIDAGVIEQDDATVGAFALPCI